MKISLSSDKRLAILELSLSKLNLTKNIKRNWSRDQQNKKTSGSMRILTCTKQREREREDSKVDRLGV